MTESAHRNELFDALFDDYDAPNIADGTTVNIVKLDKYQEQALVRSITDDCLIIAAGPGSGKTTTICEIIAQAARQPESRVLVLVFNVCAENTIQSRLAPKDVPIINKNAVSDQNTYGAAVLTFDKFAYQVSAVAAQASHEEVCDALFADDEDVAADATAASTNTAAPATSTNTAAAAAFTNHRIGIENAVIKLAKSGFGYWTHIIIDEAQDVNTYHSIMINSLCEFSSRLGKTKLIVAGDPRQELYNGATWFSHLWAERPTSEKLILAYNHRSTPKIVNILNAFSRYHFPNIHHDQIAARDDFSADGACLQEGASALHLQTRADSPHLQTRADSPQIVNFYMINYDTCSKTAKGGFNGLDTMTQLGKKCAEHLRHEEPCDAYVVAPISTKKWQIENATIALRQHISTLRPNYYAVDICQSNLGDGAAQGGDAKGRHVGGADKSKIYEIANSKKIKGTERKKVVIIGADTNYDISVDRSSQLKALFVALSRARDSLQICIRRESGAFGSDLNLIFPVLREIDPVFAEHLTLKCTKRVSYQYFIKVTGSTDAVERGLSTIEGIKPSVIKKVKSPSLSLDRLSIDLDFTGCFVELLIACALGIDLTGVGNVEFRESNIKQEWGFYSSPKGHFIYCNSKSNVDARRRIISNIKELCRGESYGYAQTVARYSVIAGAVWEISSRFRNVANDFAAPVADFITDLFTDADTVSLSSSYGISYNIRKEFNLCGDAADGGNGRAATQNPPCIIGVPDFIIGDVPIEIKYVSELTDDHRRQAAIYASMIGAEHSILLNALSGDTEFVSAIPRNDVIMYGLASIFMTNSRSIIVGNMIPTPPNIAPVVIAVHYHGNKIQALAFHAQDAGILSCYDAELDSGTESESDVDSTSKSESAFDDWVQSISKYQTYITWNQQVSPVTKTASINLSEIWNTKKLADRAFAVSDDIFSVFSYVMAGFENQYINYELLNNNKHLMIATIFSNLVRFNGMV